MIVQITKNKYSDLCMICHERCETTKEYNILQKDKTGNVTAFMACRKCIIEAVNDIERDNNWNA